MKNVVKMVMVVTVMVMVAMVTNTVTASASTAIPTYRLYNKNTGEHLFTQDKGEYDGLGRIGWVKEGTAWTNNRQNGVVFRLYNPNTGGHFYTCNGSEVNNLERHGWKVDDFYLEASGCNGDGQADSNKDSAVYRLYNPNEKGAGTHHFTTNASEYKALEKAGWRGEGVAWYK